MESTKFKMESTHVLFIPNVWLMLFDLLRLISLQGCALNLLFVHNLCKKYLRLSFHLHIFSVVAKKNLSMKERTTLSLTIHSASDSHCMII